ncbi:50S ribosome-binding GTPase, partial [candidate division KSB1 bacterium]|nr:50S ribosome-binding GTPase [candidate division KSB1 bacterium]
MQHLPKTMKDNSQQSRKSQVLHPEKSIDYHKNVILLVGSPNVGKTSVFNRLSRKYAITANYPFTTVELNIDAIRLFGREFELIDSPGILRLDHPSEEGQITRDIIINHHPEIIIQVVEASNLERSLLLTAQLLELQIPMIIVLNMIDETVKQGIRVNSRVLSELLSIPVVETIATEGKGLDGIKKSIRKLSSPRSTIKYASLVERFYLEMLNLFPVKNQPPRPIITLLALEDPFALRWIEENYGQAIAQKAAAHRNNFLDTHEINLPIAILNRQNNWVKNIIEKTITIKSEFSKFGIQKFGELSRHRVYGWFIVFIVVFFTYLLVGKFGAIFLVSKLDSAIFGPIVNYLDSIIEWAFLKRFVIGDYGLLTTGLFNAIGTVLPIITLFFLVLNLLEDIGYLTNLIILTNRLFKKLGLTGKSILPIVLGFG